MHIIRGRVCVRSVPAHMQIHGAVQKANTCDRKIRLAQGLRDIPVGNIQEGLSRSRSNHGLLTTSLFTPEHGKTRSRTLFPALLWLPPARTLYWI